MATLDLARIERGIAGTGFAGNLHHFQSIDSTNTRAVSDAQAGTAAGQVYIADRQTAGRGRGGHQWHSAADDGLYLSLLLRPRLLAADALKLSLAAGLAARCGVRMAASLQVDLRWPNDLVLPRDGALSHKLGGILTETASTPAGVLRYAVVGIGINLNQTEFPPELGGLATSVRVATGHAVFREAVLVELLRAFTPELAMLEAESAGAAPDASGTLAQRFEAASSWPRGKRVRVAEDGGFDGVTDGLTEEGLLRVRLYDGDVRIVRHGGVRELLRTETTSEAG